MSDRGWPPGRRRRRIARRVGIGLLLGLATTAMGLVPATAFGASPGAGPAPAAAGPPLQVDLALYDPCLHVRNATGDDPLTVIHRRDGTLVKKVIVPISGFIRPCVGTMRPGDTVELRQSGLRQRLITVPVLKLRVDPPRNRLTGRVPVSNRSVSVSASHQIAGLEVTDDSTILTAGTDGRFTWSPAWTLTAGDFGFLSWTSPDFDMFQITASTPSVTVSTWTPDITVTATRASRVTIVVRDAGVEQGRYARQLPPYEVLTYGKLRHGGRLVSVAKGDKVTHSGIAGTALTVLPNAITVNPADNGSLRTTCYPNGQVVIDVDDRHRFWSPVDSSGLVSWSNLTEGDGDLQSGDVIHVGCQNGKGGNQLKRTVVP